MDSIIPIEIERFSSFLSNTVCDCIYNIIENTHSKIKVHIIPNTVTENDLYKNLCLVPIFQISNSLALNVQFVLLLLNHLSVLQ